VCGWVEMGDRAYGVQPVAVFPVDAPRESRCEQPGHGLVGGRRCEHQGCLLVDIPAYSRVFVPGVDEEFLVRSVSV